MEREITVTGGLVENLHCYGETEVVKTLNTSPLVTKMKQISQNIKSAEQSASDVINNTKGVFEFIDNGDGTNSGFTIYDANGHGLLRCTAGGLGISPDGGLTYTNAITKNGVVATKLSVSQNDVTVLEAGLSGGDYSHPQLIMRNQSTGNIVARLDGYSTGASLFSMKNGNNGNDTFSVASGIEGTVTLGIMDSLSNKSLFSFLGQNDYTSLTLFHKETNNSVFSVTSGTRDGANYLYFDLRDPSTTFPLFSVMYDLIDSTPYVTQTIRHPSATRNGIYTMLSSNDSVFDVRSPSSGSTGSFHVACTDNQATTVSVDGAPLSVLTLSINGASYKVLAQRL
jgi:hypothetical protein